MMVVVGSVCTVTFTVAVFTQCWPPVCVTVTE